MRPYATSKAGFYRQELIRKVNKLCKKFTLTANFVCFLVSNQSVTAITRATLFKIETLLTCLMKAEQDLIRVNLNGNCCSIAENGGLTNVFLR